MTLETIARNLREQARRHRREAATLDSEARAIERVLDTVEKWHGTENKQAALDEIDDAVFGLEDDDDA